MAPKKIKVVDVSGRESKIMLSNEEGYKNLLQNFDVKSLRVKVDGEEFEVQDFESLADGGVYTLGLTKHHQQQLYEEEKRNAKADEVFEYILQQKHDLETLLISRPETHRFAVAMSHFGVPKDAPLWNDKLMNNFPTKAPPRFTWHASKESSHENRTAYMAYLRNTENLVLPRDTVIFDGNSDVELLSVRMEGLHLKTSGSIDVPLVNSRHQSLATVKENMLGAFELKKNTNKEHAKIERQVNLQHMAASYLNPNTGLLTMMTDLNERWHFFWFTKDKRLMRYESTVSEARFLIEHMLDEPESSISTPTGFLSRASWNDLFIAESPEGFLSSSHSNAHSNGEGDGGKDDSGKYDDDDEKGERALSHQVGALKLSRNKGFGETNTTVKRRAALDGEEVALPSSLDFIDKEEELEAVLDTAMKTTFHRMFGPPPDEASNFPPSQINC